VAVAFSMEQLDYFLVPDLTDFLFCLVHLAVLVS
jgi:hypothetical protein